MLINYSSIIALYSTTDGPRMRHAPRWPGVVRRRPNTPGSFVLGFGVITWWRGGPSDVAGPRVRFTGRRGLRED